MINGSWQVAMCSDNVKDDVTHLEWLFLALSYTKAMYVCLFAWMSVFKTELNISNLSAHKGIENDIINNKMLFSSAILGSIHIFGRWYIYI